MAKQCFKCFREVEFEGHAPDCSEKQDLSRLFKPRVETKAAPQEAKEHDWEWYDGMRHKKCRNCGECRPREWPDIGCAAPQIPEDVKSAASELAHQMITLQLWHSQRSDMKTEEGIGEYRAKYLENATVVIANAIAAERARSERLREALEGLFYMTENLKQKFDDADNETFKNAKQALADTALEGK